MLTALAYAFKCNNELYPSLRGGKKHHKRNNVVMEIVKKRNEDITKLGAFPVAVAAGDGMSSTFSLKKDPNFDAFSKT